MPDTALAPERRDADDTRPALRFITCGSVDDGKSTLIGRLLLDSRSVLQDQLASVSRSGAVDLALFTDGLSAEREQGITIDVAYRYFATARRKFIIGDAPGHEQYTRNMVTAASSADAAVVLVDATKLPWRDDGATDASHHALLPQTRRHALLLQLLRVPSVVFAVNKLDAVGEPARAFANIRAALTRFAEAAGFPVAAIVPISALQGHNVVSAAPRGWCGYRGDQPAGHPGGAARHRRKPRRRLPSRCSGSKNAPTPATPDKGRRIFWGRVATGLCAARPGRDGAARRQDGHGGRGARPRPRSRRGAGRATARASCWTARSTCPAATGCWPRATHSGRSPSSNARWPGWTTNPWWPGAPTGRCMATAGSRPASERILHQLDIHTLAEEPPPHWRPTRSAAWC
jgi:sulfate adenylyltransferase subunit 1